MNKKKSKKLAAQVLLFTAVMLLTFYAVFRGQDLRQIAAAVGQMSLQGVFLAVFLALFFVAAEGFMIWYLLRGMGGGTGLLRCMGYSYVGFFFSGLTPSATGGQPMQLYYMKKDGNSLSGSSVVLLAVAIIYKFVLVLTGIFLLLFWNRPLQNRLQGYYALYLFGLSLNVVVVSALLLVMCRPEIVRTILRAGERILVRCRLRKESAGSEEKISAFIDGYGEAVSYLRTHRRAVCVVVAGTFLQRFSAFLLTYVVYWGLGLSETAPLTIVLLQASVSIAVDMLPIPGAQGITEAMYGAVFLRVFTEQYLMPSLCLSRGISFYFTMLVSLCVTFLFWCQDIRKKENLS